MNDVRNDVCCYRTLDCGNSSSYVYETRMKRREREVDAERSSERGLYTLANCSVCWIFLNFGRAVECSSGLWKDAEKFHHIRPPSLAFALSASLPSHVILALRTGAGEQTHTTKPFA